MPHTKQSGSDAIWIVTRLAVYIRDGWACLVCGCAVSHSRMVDEASRASLDHIQPGNNHKASNLITMCLRCNNEKRRRHLKAWRPELYVEAKRRARRKLDRVKARDLAIRLGYGERIRRTRKTVKSWKELSQFYCLTKGIPSGVIASTGTAIDRGCNWSKSKEEMSARYEALSETDKKRFAEKLAEQFDRYKKEKTARAKEKEEAAARSYRLERLRGLDDAVRDVLESYRDITPKEAVGVLLTISKSIVNRLLINKPEEDRGYE